MVKNFILRTKKHISNEDFETYKDIIYQVEGTAEEEALIIGFRCGITIIMNDIGQPA